MHFTVQADHRMKVKEGEKLDKYFDLARELKTLWNIKLIGQNSNNLVNSLKELEMKGRIHLEGQTI